MTIRHLIPAAAAVVVFAVSGCATTGRGSVDVKRFHLGVPVTRGTIALVPANSAGSFSLEYRTYADAVAGELRAQGFTPAPVDSSPAYVATLTITQNVSVGPPRPSPFSIGIGAGGFTGGRGGIGIGGGVGIPVGHGRRDAVEVDAIGIAIKRTADQTLIWEGNAQAMIDTRSSQASLARAVPSMARILLDGFPGVSGVTQHVPL